MKPKNSLWKKIKKKLITAPRREWFVREGIKGDTLPLIHGIFFLCHNFSWKFLFNNRHYHDGRSQEVSQFFDFQEFHK